MDIKLHAPTSDGAPFDVGVTSGELDADSGLETAVILSLFCDRRAEEGDDLPDPTAGRRGWWADTLAEVSGDKWGSRLWLLERAKKTQDTLNRARDYAEEALQWLIDDEVVASIAVETSWTADGLLAIVVDLTRPGAAEAQRYRYTWDTLEAAYV